MMGKTTMSNSSATANRLTIFNRKISKVEKQNPKIVLGSKQISTPKRTAPQMSPKGRITIKSRELGQ